MATLATTPNPVVERIGALFVVRDDLLPGGTKDRVAGVVVADASGVVYASPGEGYAQMALARACSARGIPAVIFTAARKRPHRNTIRAATFGADIMPVRPGYLCVVQARAREHAVAHGLRYLPFGFDTPEVRDALTIAAAPVAAEHDPPEVWVAAGSGTLALALGAAFPRAVVHAVRVGRELQSEVAERCIVHRAPEAFSTPARLRPPYPSAPEYDAKVWQFVAREAASGALVWNVGA